MSIWRVKEKIASENSGIKKIHPVVLQLLLQRGVNTEKGIERFMNPDYEKDIHSPFLFSEMEKVVDRIKEAKNKNELVAIFGDYDADGVTSSAILKETLEEFGINSTIYIPDRKTEGYGMNMMAIEELKKRGTKLILTVDCGMTGVEEVELAKKNGIDVIITDHHHIPEKLPGAYAIINPHLDNSGYPDKNLAGVGVAFKVMQALTERFSPGNKDQAKWMLDLAAVGTVADCVPLVGENRAIVKFGLVVLPKTRRIGLREIFNVAKIKDDAMSTFDISFKIAPRINAAGRMDHANTAYELMMEKDIAKARELALELESSNQHRRKVTDQIVSEISALAENSYKDKKLIFAVGEHFPIGVAGLVAGKIAGEFNKPTAVLQKGKQTSEGSFRSIPQVSIIEAIESCSDLLVKFGGHDQAAGIKIENKNLDSFYEKLNAVIEKELEGKELVPEIEIDAELTADDIGIELVDGLKKMEPFGEGNKMPVFLIKNFIVEDVNVVGSNEKHLKLFLRANGNSPKIFEAIGFNFANKFKEIKKGDSVDAVFNLEEDEWNGNKKIQMKLIDMKKA